MPSQKIKAIAAKPRNPVFRALKQRLLASGGAGRHTGERRRKPSEEQDLADRIREVGEW